MGFCRKFLPLLVVVVAVSVVLCPNYVVYPFIVADALTSWTVEDSWLWDQYHKFLTATRPDRPALPLPEMDISEWSRERFMVMTKNWTFPIVIRGVLKESPALKNWANKTWWIENYGDEEVMCKPTDRTYNDKHKPFYPLKEWWRRTDSGEKIYISGTSSIFRRRPELGAMVHHPIFDEMAPVLGDKPFATQIFMGQQGTGSPIHNAVAVNVFRQIVGRKRWWFWPTSETAYLKPCITSLGYSYHSPLDWAPVRGNVTDPIVAKLERYTAVLEPGDVVMNPPWFWHAVENLDRFTIGSPARYADAGANTARRVAPGLTNIMFAHMIMTHGSFENFKKALTEENKLIDGRDALERSVARNRAKETYDNNEKPDTEK
jgi:hypothetical protein